LLMQYMIGDDKAYDDSVKMAGYVYPIHRGTTALAWNTNLVNDQQDKLLMDWKGITDPVWAGRAGVTDPSGSASALRPWYIWPKLYGDDFIPKIGALKPRVFTGSSPASAALASGDIAVILNASEVNLSPLWRSGAPVRWALPEPGIGGL